MARRRAAVREDLVHLGLVTAWVTVFFRLVEWRCVCALKTVFLWRIWFICRGGMEGKGVVVREVEICLKRKSVLNQASM